MSCQNNLLRKFLLLLFTLLSGNVYSQEIQVKLVSEKEGEPLPYRQALFKPSNFITSTNEKGILKIDKEIYALQDSIVISGFGLNIKCMSSILPSAKNFFGSIYIGTFW